MRLLLTLILLGAGLWSGYWFIGAEGSRSAFESWFSERRSGFPRVLQHDILGDES